MSPYLSNRLSFSSLFVKERASFSLSLFLSLYRSLSSEGLKCVLVVRDPLLWPDAARRWCRPRPVLSLSLCPCLSLSLSLALSLSIPVFLPLSHSLSLSVSLSLSLSLSLSISLSLFSLPRERGKSGLRALRDPLVWPETSRRGCRPLPSLRPSTFRLAVCS